jgi:hypothetical protein
MPPNKTAASGGASWQRPVFMRQSALGTHCCCRYCQLDCSHAQREQHASIKLRYNIRPNSRLALSRRQYQSAALSVHLLHRFRRQFHAVMPFLSWTSQACFCALLLTYHMPTETRHATGANALHRDILLPGFGKIATETACRSML